MSQVPDDVRELFDRMTEGYAPPLDFDRITRSTGVGRSYAVVGVSGAAAVAIVASVSLLHVGSGSHSPNGLASLTQAGNRSSHPRSSDRSVGDPTGGIAARNTPLPLDPYELLQSRSNVVLEAEYKVADECMRSEGFTPRIDQPLEPYDPSDFIPNAVTGYNDPPDPARTSWQTQLDIYAALPPPSAAYTRAYYGTSVPDSGRDSGCLGQGERAVLESSGTLNGVDPLVKSIDLATAGQADRDPRVVAVAAAWSRCMVNSGYHYSTPADALDNLPYDEDGTPGPAELAQAHADIACQTVDRYWPIEHAVRAEYQRQAIAQDLTQLTPIRRVLHSEYDRAVAVLHGS